MPRTGTKGHKTLQIIESLEFGTGGEGLFGVVAGGGFADHAERENFGRIGEVQGKGFARFETGSIGGGSCGIRFDFPDFFPLSGRRGLDLDVWLATGGVEPTAI